MYPYIDCHELDKLVGMEFCLACLAWGCFCSAPNYTAQCASDSSSEGQIQQDALLSMVNTPWVYVQTPACHFHGRQTAL